jgi:predicted DNA-binding transcriptional regulator AlpA
MDLFGVRSRSTIYRWIEEGNLPRPVKRWGSPMWDEETIRRILAEKAPF